MALPNPRQPKKLISRKGLLTNPPGPINTLPSDLLQLVWDLLDLDSSTSLGLTSRAFYPVHRALHGAVPFSPRMLARLGEWDW